MKCRGTSMISVAMCTYNGETYIENQLDSICRQTRKVDEIVICDDQSTDQTVSIVESYAKTSTVPIRLYINEENLGYKLNFHKAMSKCLGDFIFLSDQDDEWLNNKVEVMMELFEANEDMRVLASGCNFIDGEGTRIEVQPIPGMSNNNLYTKEVGIGELVKVGFDEFLTHNFFQGCSLLMDQEIKDEIVEHFSTKIHHDWFINLTASKHDGMYFYNAPLFNYRIYAGNAIGVPNVNRSYWQRLKETNTMKIRTQLSKEGLLVLEALEESDPNYYQAHREELDGWKEFYQKHTEYLEKHKAISLLLQNRNPYYKRLKTRNARIMDVIFALEHKQ